jgi:type I restriction-modification system DNA methylase subunit
VLGRLKFDIAPLVEEILDQLPREVWSSSTTTFLDPAIGGGQFVAGIERRLRDAGHTDKNIASRVYGYESNYMRINYAVNKYNLVGSYTNNKFIEEKNNPMKFDVIIGNPPYQNSHKKDSESKRKVGNKLWYQFVFKADELVKPNGHVALVTPTQWMSGGVQMRKGNLGVLKNIFGVKQLKIAKVANITEKYFKNIGINIGYFVYQNTPNTKPSKFILKDSELNID